MPQIQYSSNTLHKNTRVEIMTSPVETLLKKLFVDRRVRAQSCFLFLSSPVLFVENVTVEFFVIIRSVVCPDLFFLLTV